MKVGRTLLIALAAYIAAAVATAAPPSLAYVSTTTQLRATPSYQAKDGVWRLGANLANILPVYYLNSGLACPGGIDDAGSQIASSDGKCWIGQFSTTVDVRSFGADPTALTDSTTAFRNASTFIQNNRPGGELSCGAQAASVTGFKYEVGGGAQAGVPLFSITHGVKWRHCQLFVQSTTTTTDLFNIIPATANDVEGFGFSDIGIYPLTGGAVWRHTFNFGDGGNGAEFIRHLEFHEVTVGVSTGRPSGSVDMLLTASINMTGAVITAGGTGYGASQTGNVTWNGAGCSTNPVINVTTNSSGVVTTVNSVTNAGVCQVQPSSVAANWTPSSPLSAGSGLELALTPSGTGFFFSTTIGPNVTLSRCVWLQNLGDSVTFLQPTVTWSSTAADQGNCSFNISNHPDGAGEFSLIDPNLTAVYGLFFTNVYGAHIRGGVLECSGSGLTGPNNSFINLSNSNYVHIDAVQVQGGPCVGGSAPKVLTAVNTTNIDGTFIAGTNLAGTDQSGRYVLDAGSTQTATVSQVGGALTAWTPTASCDSGSLGTGNTIVANYGWIPHTNLVYFEETFTYGASGNGTCAGALHLTLPFTGANGIDGFGQGKEVALTGKFVSGASVQNTNNYRMTFYDGTYPGANSAIVETFGIYKAVR